MVFAEDKIRFARRRTIPAIQRYCAICRGLRKDKSLDHLRTAIKMRWPENHTEVAAWFDELSPNLQVKALHTFLHNSGAEFDDLVAKVKRQATLAETAELNGWLTRAA